MTEPDRSPPGDELTERYREASAQDTRRPGAHVRDAVRAHAQMVIAAGEAQSASAAATGTTPSQAQARAPAANQSRWKISALASLALVGLTGLLVLQFDRGSDEEKDLVFGQRSASEPPAAAPTPAPAAAPATTTPQAPQPPQPEARAKARVAESPPASAFKAPATPAAKKSVPPPTTPGQAAPKAEAETAQALGGAAPPAAAPAPAAPPAAALAPAPAVTQDSAGYSVSGRTAGAAASPQATAPPAPTQQADISAPAPVARSAAPAAPSAPARAAAAPPAPLAAAPAAAAPAAAAPAAEQRQEKSAAPARSLRAEATGSLGLASALQQSARAGDLQQLERLLRQGAPLNAADTAGRTPLILAVMQGHTAVVQRLLAAGANPALIDKDGLNALQHAKQLGLDGIAHLIERAS